MNAPDTVIIAAFGTAFTVLGTTIAVLAKKFYTEHQDLKAESKECRADRELLWEKVTELQGKVGRPAKCHVPACPWP